MIGVVDHLLTVPSARPKPCTGGVSAWVCLCLDPGKFLPMAE